MSAAINCCPLGRTTTVRKAASDTRPRLQEDWPDGPIFTIEFLREGGVKEDLGKGVRGVRGALKSEERVAQLTAGLEAHVGMPSERFALGRLALVLPEPEGGRALQPQRDQNGDEC
ncbi:MAG TPA: hypothetical protein VGV10_05380 [Thermoleophilaceae bacterium]|nr:hypothetical protein [Thermoleophilaceae bacterium]